MQSQASVTESAPAKLNLYLHITGRRDDGYHLLESLIVFTEFGDVVTVSPADELSLTVHGPFACAIDDLGADNLVMRAATALATGAGVSRGAAIDLEKRLPVAAGIGGGSADAAATLRALIRLWGIEIEDRAIHDMALKLGADVPACLAGRPVVATGIGDMLASLGAGWPAFDIVLVNPGTPLSTPAVFRARSGPFRKPVPFSGLGVDRGDAITESVKRDNDLEAPACALEPAVRRVLAALRRQNECLLARMSGSGATCFGIFESAHAASQAARSLREQEPNWWVVATKTRAS